MVNQPYCRNLVGPMIGLVFALAKGAKYSTTARAIRSEDVEGHNNLVQMLRWEQLQRTL